MSNDNQSPNVETNETNVQNNLSTQSGYPNMSNEKTFLVQNGLEVQGDAVVSGTVTATSFIGDGSQLTGISGGGGDGGLDSAGVQGIVDDNITGGIVSVQIGPSTSVANALQQTVIGPSASSTGQYNVAIGRNASVQSSRTAATAVGNGARVGSSQGGNNGVAVGTNAVVEKNAGTAIGPNAYVKNGDNATAVGMQANAWGTSALALGHGASATSTEAIAIGTNTSSSQADTIAMGTSSVASGSRSVAIGNGTDATGGSSVALGNSAQALATNAIAIGVSADTNVNADGIAIGSNTEVKGAQGISIGQTAEASQASVAIGSNASVTTGTESTAIGPFAGATGNASLALGRGAKANANNTIALAATGANSTVATQYGIDIRTSAAGSLTYDTTNDWVFGATVTLPGATISGHIIPSSNETYDLGSAENKFRDLYMSTATIHTDEGNISTIGGVLKFGEEPVMLLSDIQDIAADCETFADFKSALANL